MIWRDGVRCPLCGSRTEVSTGKPPERFRQCLNSKCRKGFWTQEVLRTQANELQTWYTEMVEQKGGGWGPLYGVAEELYEKAVTLGLMLGLLKEKNDDGSREREHAAAGNGGN